MERLERSETFRDGAQQASSYLSADNPFKSYSIVKRDGSRVQFDLQKVRETVSRYIGEYSEVASADLIAREVIKNIFDGISTRELERAMVLATQGLLELDPVYDKVATRLLLQMCYKENFNVSFTDEQKEKLYQQAFKRGIQIGIDRGILSTRLLEYDLEVMAQEIKIERDEYLNYLGLQTLYDRYFLKDETGDKIELPQTFWLRIAMGLALDEDNKQERALEFYHMLSKLRYLSSTPTLFHAGFKTAQLSSCYLTTVKDDLGHIFKCIGDNAQLSKWAGGIGNDWTNIRGTGSIIKSIHATSQGVLPFLKIANDVVAGITKSGIRRGGTCVYLETWHLDIEDFLDLRRNTGDERRRAHDLNTANWIPDLFMKRVLNDESWTLFSPDETPDLHSLYGAAFEARYVAYEKKAQEGVITHFKTISALKLWRKMLSRLFETGHPWITFKDPCNVRSPQDHVGVVHSSNLCTEITLNTSEDETAVCNLGSVNLGKHVVDGQLDYEMLKDTVTKAIRILDNVIDLNFYPTKEAETSNKRHRPIGLGLMGFQDALYKLNIAFDSEGAITFADQIQERILYYAVEASCDLARDKGAYPTFKGSKWDRDIFPQDTIALLEQERGMSIDCSRESMLDWAPLRAKVKKYGLRNSNMLSVAPTATIANIAGCFPCIEPIYKNIYVKSNIAGEFTIVNKHLVQDLKKHDLWSKAMLDQLKMHDGELGMIESIPMNMKHKYKTSFELDPEHLIRVTAARGKWIDQSQSHNVFMRGVSGKKLNDIYMAAWKCGLKTTYYLRTLGATGIEKASLKTTARTQTRAKVAEAVSGNGGTAPAMANGNGSTQTMNMKATNGQTPFAFGCDISNGECESCQ